MHLKANNQLGTKYTYQAVMKVWTHGHFGRKIAYRTFFRQVDHKVPI
jgi:hypothetical protein